MAFKEGSKTKSYSEKTIVSILLKFLQNVHFRDKKLFEKNQLPIWPNIYIFHKI